MLFGDDFLLSCIGSLGAGVFSPNEVVVGGIEGQIVDPCVIFLVNGKCSLHLEGRFDPSPIILHSGSSVGEITMFTGDKADEIRDLLRPLEDRLEEEISRSRGRESSITKRKENESQEIQEIHKLREEIRAHDDVHKSMDSAKLHKSMDSALTRGKASLKASFKGISKRLGLSVDQTSETEDGVKGSKHADNSQIKTTNFDDIFLITDTYCDIYTLDLSGIVECFSSTPETFHAYAQAVSTIASRNDRSNKFVLSDSDLIRIDKHVQDELEKRKQNKIAEKSAAGSEGKDGESKTFEEEEEKSGKRFIVASKHDADDELQWGICVTPHPDGFCLLRQANSFDVNGTEAVKKFSMEKEDEDLMNSIARSHAVITKRFSELDSSMKELREEYEKTMKTRTAIL
jgi:hypothetical protein